MILPVSDKIHRHLVRDQPCFVALIQELLNGLASILPVVHGPFIDVHRYKAVSLLQIQSTAKLKGMT